MLHLLQRLLIPSDLTSRHSLVQGHAKNERAGCHLRVHNSMNYCTEMILRAKMLEEERKGKRGRGDRQRKKKGKGRDWKWRCKFHNTIHSQKQSEYLGNGKATSLCEVGEDWKKCMFLYYVCMYEHTAVRHTKYRKMHMNLEKFNNFLKISHK